MGKFVVKSEYSPTGDQPQAIRKIADSILAGEQAQTLMGVTGSGKTFTMAKIIEAVQKPTLVIAHRLYTVTDADMIGPTLYNQAECLYDLDGETYSVKSNIVEAPLDQPLEEPIIDLHEHYDFKPANGSYYTPGEKVELIIDISNPNSVPLKDVKVYNPLYWSGESGTVVKHYETMDPYFSDTMGFVYEIQGPDADQGTIYNTSTADGYFGNDFLHAASEPVTIPTGYPNPEKRIPFGLSISKVETSKPTHDGKYWIDEVITYDITVTNTGSYPLFNVTVKDSLKMEDGGVLGVISTFGPSESKTYSFS